MNARHRAAIVAARTAYDAAVASGDAGAKRQARHDLFVAEYGRTQIREAPTAAPSGATTTHHPTAAPRCRPLHKETRMATKSTTTDAPLSDQIAAAEAEADRLREAQLAQRREAERLTAEKAEAELGLLRTWCAEQIAGLRGLVTDVDKLRDQAVTLRDAGRIGAYTRRLRAHGSTPHLAARGRQAAIGKYARRVDLRVPFGRQWGGSGYGSLGETAEQFLVGDRATRRHRDSLEAAAIATVDAAAAAAMGLADVGEVAKMAEPVAEYRFTRHVDVGTYTDLPSVAPMQAPQILTLEGRTVTLRPDRDGVVAVWDPALADALAGDQRCFLVGSDVDSKYLALLGNG